MTDEDSHEQLLAHLRAIWVIARERGDEDLRITVERLAAREKARQPPAPSDEPHRAHR